VAVAIRELVVRGAPAIGVTAAYGMALAARKSAATDRTGLLDELVREVVFEAQATNHLVRVWYQISYAIYPSTGKSGSRK
jgi:methylthioribose-1-phosphate isomerase